jgi:hypothetical protein
VTPEDDLFAVKDVSDEAKSVWAVKPWLGSIVEPKNAPANVTSAPDKKLELTWACMWNAISCTLVFPEQFHATVCDTV